MELWQRIKELGQANHDLLFNYKWEWFGSFTLPVNDIQRISFKTVSFMRKHQIGYAEAESYLKAWRMKMGIRNHILIAYMGAYNTIPQPHIHLLLWGKRNRFGQTLMDLEPKDWQAGWADIAHRKAVIEPIYDRDQVSSYIANKNLPWGKSELIQPYNKRLLGKAMIR